MRHRFFASGGRIVSTKCVAVFIQTIQTIAHADARPDAFFFSGCNFFNDVRGSHVRPCHADHIQQIFPQSMTGRCNFVDAGGMKNRQIKFTFDCPGKLQLRSRHSSHIWDNVRQSFLRVNMAFDDVNKIECAGVDQHLTDFKSFFEA